MILNFIPLFCGILGLFTGVVLGSVITLFLIYTGTIRKEKRKVDLRKEIDTDKLSLATRMNNQDYAISHQPGYVSAGIEEKQKKEDSAYQFLKRNRKE